MQILWFPRQWLVCIRNKQFTRNIINVKYCLAVSTKNTNKQINLWNVGIFQKISPLISMNIGSYELMFVNYANLMSLIVGLMATREESQPGRQFETNPGSTLYWQYQVRSQQAGSSIGQKYDQTLAWSCPQSRALYSGFGPQNTPIALCGILLAPCWFFMT